MGHTDKMLGLCKIKGINSAGIYSLSSFVMNFPLRSILIALYIFLFFLISEIIIPPSFQLAIKSCYQDVYNCFLCTLMGCLVCRGYHDHVLVCIHDVVFYLSIYIPFIDVVCTKTFKVIFVSFFQ